MTKLILIRHGMTDDNLLYLLSGITDTPLNEVGMRQAEHTADVLYHRTQTGEAIDALYASPLQRTSTTAQIIAKRLGLPVNFHDGLKEMHMGIYEGAPILELYEREKEMIDRALNPGDEEFGWAGGETRQQIYQRAQFAISSIVSRHPDQTVGVVTHGGIIAYFAAGIAGKPLSHWNFYHVANCSITEVHYRDGLFQLLSHNLTDHVAKEKYADLIHTAKKRLGIPITPSA